MRILFLSRSYVFDGGSSLTNVPKAVLGEMLRRHEDMTLTWVIPRNASEEEVHADVVAPLRDVADRLHMVRAATDGFGRMMGYYLTDEIANMFRQTKTEMPYDLVLNQHPALTLQYRTILANRYRASRFNVDVPIVNWHLWTATLDQLAMVPEYYVGEPDIAAETVGAFFAHHNVWESEYLLRSHKRTLREWLAPHAIRDVLGKSSHIHAGIGYDAVREIALPVREKRVADREGPTLFWGGRFANQKKAKVTLPLMREVNLRHPKSNVIITTSHHKIPDWAETGYPDWRIEKSINREAWFDRLGYGDVFLCNSVSEGYGSAWLEMLAAEQLGVFERQWWLDGFLPDWYPFVADTQQEQVEMASALMHDWPDGPLWKEFVPKVQEWLREEHNAVYSSVKLHDVLAGEHRAALERQASLGKGTVGTLVGDAARAALDGAEAVPIDEVFNRMSMDSDTEREWGKHGDIISRVYLRQCLLAAGWRDVGGLNEVVMAPPVAS